MLMPIAGLPAWLSDNDALDSCQECAIALFKWMRWGFWGYCISCVVVLIAGLLAGVGTGRSVLSPTSALALYGVHQIGKENNGWRQLK